MKAVIVNGSPRKKGNTAFVCARTAEVLSGRGIDSHILNLCDIDFSTCIGCERCRKDKICTGIKDGLTPFYDVIKESDLWVLGTPVHNYNVTALMKAFLDRLYCFYEFTDSRPRGFSSSLSGRGIRAVVFGIAEQMTEEDFGFTIEAMAKPLTALGVDVAVSSRFFGYFEAGALARDRERVGDYIKQIDDFAGSLIL